MLLSDGIREGPALKLAYLVLALNVVVAVWDQYALYYMPLIIYRGAPETFAQQLLTVTITLLLAAVPIVASRNSDILVPVTLLAIILLSIVKVRQMNGMLPHPNHSRALASSLHRWDRSNHVLRTRHRELTTKLALNLLVLAAASAFVHMSFRFITDLKGYKSEITILSYGVLFPFLQWRGMDTLYRRLRIHPVRPQSGYLRALRGVYRNRA